MSIKSVNTTFLSEVVFQEFVSRHGARPLVVRSPGRINLIGEHTDYNSGLVLPAAIDKDVVLAISKREDRYIHLYAVDKEESHVTSLGQLAQSSFLWPDYILGVIQQLLKAGHPIAGLNIAFAGSIPQGAGLSSSAALTCATAYAVNELFELGMDRLQLALVAQAAENEFVGLNCGIMDQFASLFGKQDHLIKLDCEDLSYEYIPFHDPKLQLVLLDTHVKHSLASSAYNERREQCEYGVSLVQAHFPGVSSLRDINMTQLEDLVKPVDETVFRRCRYVVSEIQRVKASCDDIRANDFNAFGKKMFETHHGLQHDYAVSCEELDVLVELAKEAPVLGARMMGGGFGGCTINLIYDQDAWQVAAQIAEAYKQRLGKSVEPYFVKITEGSSVNTIQL